MCITHRRCTLATFRGSGGHTTRPNGHLGTRHSCPGNLNLCRPLPLTLSSNYMIVVDLAMGSITKTVTR